MPEYRAYTVGTDGHFIGYEPLICADDREAIEIAKRISIGFAVELWNGPRLVDRFPAPGSMTAPTCLGPQPNRDLSGPDIDRSLNLELESLGAGNVDLWLDRASWRIGQRVVRKDSDELGIVVKVNRGV